MNNNSTNLSKLPYKGTSDIYPEDMKTLQYIFNTWRKVAKRFGYEEYDTPLIEDANLYKIKSGEEIANNQLYSFTDKGGREIAIRPELTPSLARMIAQKKKELTFPIRWFNIGRFYRYEKPQRGRSREFFQLNIDLLGTSSVGAELEILQYILAVMDEFNAPKETYEIKLNSRYLLDYLLEKILKVDENLKNDVLKAIDNYLKMERDDFIEYIKDIGLDNEQSSSLMDFLNWSIEDVEKIDKKSRGIKDLLELFRIIKDQGLSNITFSPYIVRGLQYYTGTVFEMYDVGSKENPRALFGGGRYDDLLEIFGEEKIPAIGLGWGNVTTLNYLETYNLIPTFDSDIDLFITLMEESLLNETIALANRFREKGVKTKVQLTSSKLSKQFKYANKLEIPWVAVLGEDELKNNTITLKDMKEGDQYTLSFEDVLEKIL
jgi:histidyl-tRNA synthetase